MPSSRIGAPPGTLQIDPRAPAPQVRVMAYGPDRLVEKEIQDLRDLQALLDEFSVTWVDVQGLGDAVVLEQLADLFGLHRLALEDVVNVIQRPKVETYGDHMLIIMRMPHLEDKLTSEQVSMFLGKNFVLSFQEQPGDCFDPVRARLREGRVRIRSGKPDYLAYALLDALVDGYFPLLDHYGGALGDLETEILAKNRQPPIARLHRVKRELANIRRYVWPLRDLFSVLAQEESRLVAPKTRIFLRDCQDHAVQLIDLVESYREMGSGLMDLHLTMVSNRMNEVMKVLTIIATIFIPLSFIAGLYGMNFDTAVSRWNLPELSWAWGYPFALGTMATVAIGLLFYFRRKGWLGGQDDVDGGDREG